MVITLHVHKKLMILGFHYTIMQWITITISNVYKMSGRSVSVYADTSALHTNFVNYLSNDLKQSCFQITFKK